jgi:ADP-ribose pyrophosphatase
MPKHYEILEKTVAYDGYFKILKYRFRHGLFAGGSSEPLERELFERGHAVAVLPYDAERDSVLLVEQFRVGALEAPRGPWLMEIVAGMIEPGETPESVARREAVEEAGCTVQELVPICRYLVSPGGTSEQVSLFAARADLSEVGGIHGLDHEGEDIRAHVVPFDQAMDMLSDGIIHVAPALIALQWLALNRERLRDLWLEH